MKHASLAWISLPVLGVAALVLALWAADTGIDSSGEKVSYSLGYDLGRKMAADFENLDLQRFQAGIEDAYLQRESKLGAGEMDFIVGEFGREVARRARGQRERIAARNGTRSQEFLAANARNQDVRVTSSGLQYRVLRTGHGDRPEVGSRVRVHHRASFLDGTEFENTYAAQPAEFVVGDGILPGYLEALELMSEGSRWELFVPPHLAYGARGQPASSPGAPGVEPNSTLIFEVELLTVNGLGH